MVTYNPGKKNRVWMNGLRMSRYIDSLDLQRQADALEVTVLENDDKNFIAGLRYDAVTFTGIFDGSSDKPSEQVAKVLGSSSLQVWTQTPEGDAVGKLAQMWQANETQVDIQTPANGRIALNGACMPTKAVKAGKVHIQGTVALTSTGAQTSIDNAVATAAGGRAHFHLTNICTGLTGFTAKIQHSSNNSAWGDLLTFSQTSTGGATSTASGTIKRYTRGIVTAFTVSGAAKTVNCLASFGRSS